MVAILLASFFIFSDGIAQEPSAAQAQQSAPDRTVSITKVVGEAGGKIVTSREVRINQAIGISLAKSALRGEMDSAGSIGQNAAASTTANFKGGLRISAATDAGFPQLVLKVLDEWTVFLEAGEIGTKAAEKTEVARLAKIVNEAWRGHADWESIEPSAQEVRDIIERKLVAQALEKLKSEASMVSVSDEEALQYYKKNRLRFGNMPFENFRENIKAALLKAQMERRMLEWRSVLRRKYRVRNFVGA